MGVQGVFPFLKKHKVGYTHYPTLESFQAADASATYYLDFSACFFHFITSRVMNEHQADSCARYIVDLIKQIPNVVVVFDGPGRSQEKWETSISRLTKNKAELEKLQELIDVLTNTRPPNISKSKWRWIEKLRKRCRIMDLAFIERYVF